MKTPKFDLDKELESCKSIDDLCGKNGLVQRLIGGMMEKMLEQEMDEHLGYEKHAVSGRNKENSRNGNTSKTVQSSYGPVDLHTPRDREGAFEPKLSKRDNEKLARSMTK